MISAAATLAWPPGSGSTAIANSREMAQMVVRYLLLNHDVPVYRIYTVGMVNVAERLHVLFGDEGKIIVRSRDGQGTLVVELFGISDLCSGWERLILGR